MIKQENIRYKQPLERNLTNSFEEISNLFSEYAKTHIDVASKASGFGSLSDIEDGSSYRTDIHNISDLLNKTAKSISSSKLDYSR